LKDELFACYGPQVEILIFEGLQDELLPDVELDGDLRIVSLSVVVVPPYKDLAVQKHYVGITKHIYLTFK
jgi:hypothetical protein